MLTPGASTAVVVRNVLAGGRTAGVAAACGALVGNITYAVGAGIGLVALLSRVPAVFLLVRAGGAAYMAWLGARTLWKAWRAGGDAPAVLRPTRAIAEQRMTPPTLDRSAFAQGLTTNLLNPAVAAFYLVAVPTFLPDGRTATPIFAVFAAIHVVLAFAYHIAWAWGFHALRQVWSNPRPRRIVETLTGVALIALAAKIAVG